MEHEFNDFNRSPPFVRDEGVSCAPVLGSTNVLGLVAKRSTIRRRSSDCCLLTRSLACVSVSCFSLPRFSSGSVQTGSVEARKQNKLASHALLAWSSVHRGFTCARQIRLPTSMQHCAVGAHGRALLTVSSRPLKRLGAVRNTSGSPHAGGLPGTCLPSSIDSHPCPSSVEVPASSAAPCPQARK